MKDLDVVNVTAESGVDSKSTPFLAPEDNAGTGAVTIGVSDNVGPLLRVVDRVVVGALEGVKVLNFILEDPPMLDTWFPEVV